MPKAKKQSASTRVIQVEGELMTGEDLMIKCHNEGMNSGDIARVYGALLGIKKSAISTTITKLIEDGDKRIIYDRRDNKKTISVGLNYVAVVGGHGERVRVQYNGSGNKPDEPGL